MTSEQSQYAVSEGGASSASARDRAHDPQVLAQLIARSGERAVLIKGGTVLTQDAAIGDLAEGDVLIRGSKIVSVGPNLDHEAGDAIVLDASDAIVLPGFVDSHVHAWEGQLRGMAPVLDFGGYLGFTAFGYGPTYRPHDNYVGTLATALVCLDAGITTIVDNSHNSLTPDHSNAAVEALIDSGIRGVHASGAPVSGQPEGWPADVLRLRDEYFQSDDQRVTLRLFDLYPSEELWAFAKAEDLWVSSEMGAHIENVGDVLASLAGAGLLTEKHTFNHCFDLPESAWKLIADAGVAVNLCPRSDAAFGLGSSFPPVDAARAAGIVPGLSGDNEVSYGLSMFTEMQSLLNKHRGAAFLAALTDPDAAPAHLSPSEVLTYATLGGAANAGLADRVGSLTPGKEADVILVRTSDVNTAPGSNAMATITAFAHAGNVDTVIVGGEVRKFRGEIVGLDTAAIRGLIEASRDYLIGARGLRGDVLAVDGAVPA